MVWRRFLTRLIAALYFGTLIGLAFVPASIGNLDFWVWTALEFVPVGALLVLLLGRRRWWAALGFSVLGAAWIEAAQSVWMPVGYAAAEDVLWATLGASAGILVTVVVDSALARRRASPAAVVPSPGKQGSVSNLG
jgi:hypothetical protein